MDVRVGEQAQSLQPFLVGYGLRKSGNRGGIEDVAALHGSGHVQMVFNERLNFPSFLDRKSTRLNSSHVAISYAVFCLKKKKVKKERLTTLDSTGVFITHMVLL